MNDQGSPERRPPRLSLSDQIRQQEVRKLRARRRAVQSIWFGLGMFGMVGWSVAVPTVLGAVLGRWLDRRYPGPHSWTLTLLIIGLVIGCTNAWYWVDREYRKIHNGDNHQ